MSYLGRIRTLWLGRGNGRGGVTTGNHIKKSPAAWADRLGRSEEHTSELQSQSNLVCRLLLEKKKTRPLDKPRTDITRYDRVSKVSLRFSLCSCTDGGGANGHDLLGAPRHSDPARHDTLRAAP